jgi:hypothetical protein
LYVNRGLGHSSRSHPDARAEITLFTLRRAAPGRAEWRPAREATNGGPPAAGPARRRTAGGDRSHKARPRPLRPSQPELAEVN